MRKLFLLFILLLSFSCNDDDYTPPVDYSKNIELKHSNLKHYSTDVLQFYTDVINTSDKDITIDVMFDIYLFDTKYESKYLQSFKVSKNSNIRVYREFDFTYFKNQIYVPRNVKFVITRIE